MILNDDFAILDVRKKNKINLVKIKKRGRKKRKDCRKYD